MRSLRQSLASGADLSLGTRMAITATATAPNQVQVSWTNGAPPATQFNVYRAVGTCAAPGPFTRIASAVASSPYTDNTVSGGTTYAYKVAGTEATGNCESTQSSCMEVTATGACTLAPTFAGLSTATNAATASCNTLLTWAAGAPSCSGPLTYNIYRSTSTGFVPAPANLLASAVTGTGYSDSTGLVSGTPYYYVVRAVDSSNSIADTNTVQRSVTRGLVHALDLGDRLARRLGDLGARRNEAGPQPPQQQRVQVGEVVSHR